MKRLFITAMLSIAAAGTAFAADLPQPMPAPQVPAAYIPTVAPVYNWGGIYVGINGGWGWGQIQWTVGPAGNSPRLRVQPVTPAAWLVVPLEPISRLTPSYSGWKAIGSYSAINTGTTGAVCSTFGTCQTGNNWLATARARVGYAADRVLFFGTAGGAFANMQTTYSGVQSSTTKAGWTAGAGVEWAFADNWTAKVEYLYIDLGTFNGNCSTAACVGVTGSTCSTRQRQPD